MLKTDGARFLKKKSLVPFFGQKGPKMGFGGFGGFLDFEKN